MSKIPHKQDSILCSVNTVLVVFSQPDASIHSKEQCHRFRLLGAQIDFLFLANGTPGVDDT